MPLTGSLGLSKGGGASLREARPLTGTLGLSQGGRVFLRNPGSEEAQPLTGSPGLSQGGPASHREAGPGMSCKNTNKVFILSNIQVLIMQNRDILDIATKQ